MKSIFLFLLTFFITIFPQIPNIKVNTSGNSPNEVSIAINPIDPNNLIAGANISYIYYSTNGGLNWIQNNLSSTYGVWGDPVIVYDLNGHAYYGHLSNPSSPGYWIDRIVVQKTTNKGAAWSSGVGVGYNPPTKNQDKEWLAVDWTNSPYRNYIYMAWSEFDNYGSSSPSDSSRILFSRSTDGGLTFSAPIDLSEKDGDCIDEDNTVEGAVPAVGPNGEVYLSWMGPLGLVFSKSTNAGITWSKNKVLTTIPGGWDFMIPGIQRANGFPVTCTDISNSIYRGNIYINWSDQRNGTTNTDIFLLKSSDGGTTWSNIIKVNQDNTNRQQFFNWMTVDPGTGYLYIAYYDRRNYTDNKTDFYISRSTDGGDTFTDIKVSQNNFTPLSSVFFGDYSNIAALNGKVYPIWTRMDGSALSVYIAIFQDTLPTNTTTSFPISEGWNLLSLPLTSTDMTANNLFPNKTSNVYSFDNAYIPVDTLKLGRGYWIKFPASQNFNQTGMQQSTFKVPVKEGWNLIGGLNGNIAVSSITTTPSDILVSSFYEFNNGYQVANTISKGKGYWIKCGLNGTINLSVQSFKSDDKDIFALDKFDKLIISDSKNSATLYLLDKVFDQDLYDMPPLPPQNIFDARFINNKNATLIGENNSIQLSGASNSLKVKLISNKDYKIIIKSKSTYELSKNKEITINESDLKNLKISFEHFSSEKYLSQNYPNPFNGNTKINFYLPKIENKLFDVKLVLYNILGQAIQILYDEKINGGFHTISLNANNNYLSSGIYFYELLVKDQNNDLISREIKKLNYIK